LAGEAVAISRATQQIDNSIFNDFQTVTSIGNKDPTTGFFFSFTFNLRGDPNPPNSSSGASPSGYFGRLWQAGRVVVENNVMEIVPSETNWQSPVAILFGFAGPVLSPLLVPQAVLRRNSIRHPDGTSDPSLAPVVAQSAGIQVSGCQALIVEENVLDVERPSPLLEYYCGRTEFFANQTSSGGLVPGAQGTDYTLAVKLGELTTTVEDATLLAF